MGLKLTLAQMKALSKFESINGRHWKSRLRNAWITGRWAPFSTDDVAALQSLRNNHTVKQFEALRISEVREQMHHAHLVERAQYLVDRLNESGTPGYAVNARADLEGLLQESPAHYKGNW